MTTSKKIVLFILFFPSFFLMADEDSLKYAFTGNVLTYANDTLSRYFGKQKRGVAEILADLNDNRTFDLLTKKYL